MREALTRLLEPPIEALGFELVELELVPAQRGGTLRIYIDSARGAEAPRAAGAPSQGGISVDDCAAVSHVVSQILDAEDPIKGHYTLEVSSPGLERVLRKRAHFDRFVGERIFVELKLPLEGRRRFAGTLQAVHAAAIVVQVDGRAHELPLERIQKARLRPE